MNDFYITEATEFSEGSFENVARRILKTQRKLGALKGLSVSTMSLSDSRKDRLKKAGLFSVAAITGAALAGAGVHAAKGSNIKFPKFGKGKATKEDFLDEDYLMEAPGAYNARRTAGATQRSVAATNANRAARRSKQVAANRARVSGKPSQRKRPGSGLSGANSQYAHSARKVQYDKGRAELGLAKTSSSASANLPASLRAKKAVEYKGEQKRIMAAGAKAIAQNGGGKGDALTTKRGINGKLVGAGLAAAGAAGVAGYYAAGRNKQSVVIEAKYAYGTKLFQVYKATQEEIAEHVDKEIMKVLTRTVASLKSATDWTVKESVSEAFIQRAALSEILIEEALTSQLEEDALLEEYEAYIFEEEDDEDLAEAYYFEEDEEDDELVEAYIFEEDEEEEEEEEEEDDEEDDEDLAEAYYFED